MKDEIKKILNVENYRNKDGYVENINLLPDEIHKLLDYITNLQEENEKLKELCDKYEEEHNTEFKIWKDERYQLLDYKSINEKIINKISLYRMDDITMETNRILDDLLNTARGVDKE